MMDNMALKDQSGSSAADQWLERRGRGTYVPRRRGRSVGGDVTEPIRIAHYIRVTTACTCLRCGGGIVHRSNRTGGGWFWICSVAGCGWYISWNRRKDTGRQVRI